MRPAFRAQPFYDRRGGVVKTNSTILGSCYHLKVCFSRVPKVWAPYFDTWVCLFLGDSPNMGTLKQQMLIWGLGVPFKRWHVLAEPYNWQLPNAVCSRSGFLFEPFCIPLTRGTSICPATNGCCTRFTYEKSHKVCAEQVRGRKALGPAWFCMVLNKRGFGQPVHLLVCLFVCLCACVLVCLFVCLYVWAAG